ncbi:phenol 2-monooxygenase [Nannizzia gypsea CBS 118893]|uniref:Phenol 2-monooxygenase n=1 Tax=Arthroderma gypseum (strain ATCC MYA-4604 / CBS 118893) TaxID=535722 RepID=E4UXC5_ARTGP|nr:phenol 2-monooxygenase [Nannizzia gypsea CBS 118893]EFR01873.1 phenol 2-monooxygenase [Nannizzia gypsea CBS 118893]
MREEVYDIVIVGAGPFGLFLSLCLSRWGYNVKHIDNRDVPTRTGRADGIQPRSVEILRNLGVKKQLVAHTSARLYNVAFWDPDPNSEGIHRTSNWPSCPPTIGARYPFTLTIHQGIIERVFLDEMSKCGTIVERPSTIVGFLHDKENSTYPVSVTLKSLDTNVERTVRTKYLIGGEGTRSFIREQLGIKMQRKGPISAVWAVMDGVVRTNFPDIRKKCTIHSHSGSVMVIPRENNLVRLYTQISSPDDPDWDPKRTATIQQAQDSIIKALKPYDITWDMVDWYSTYPIGQGLADSYSLDQRIFIGGDACHTHSPKAGQGMNAGFHDALNLAWKIHAVEAGFADRSILESYEAERRYIAQQLLGFDAKYTKLFSQRLSSKDPSLPESKEFTKLHKAAAEFTSGYGIVYPPNVFNWHPNHRAKSPLFISDGTILTPGRCFPPATVTRLADSNPVHLEHEIPMNGSFRILIFAGSLDKSRTALADFCRYIEEPSSFYALFATPELCPDPYFEKHNPHSRFFTIAAVFMEEKDNVDISTLPRLLKAYHHHIYADDLVHKSAAQPIGSIHKKLGFDTDRPGVVVIRPDGHVACILRLEEGTGTIDALNKYFGTFTSKITRELTISRL